MLPSLLFCLLVLRQSPPAAAAPPADLAARVDAFVQPFVDDQQLSGSLLIAKDAEVLYERHFGCANHELGTPVTATTRFCIASVTKPMTQAVVIGLIADGVLGVDDPLAKWLPEFPGGKNITVMHLLNHRAGIPHRVTTDADEIVPQTAASMTALAAQKPALGPPGERSVYSSAGYSVLARVAELATGKDFDVLLAERLFAPAAMTCTCSATGRTLIPDRAASYAATPAGLCNAPPRDFSFLVGAGSVFSTPRDLLRFLRAIVDGRLGRSVAANALAKGKVDWNGIANGYRCFVAWDPGSGIAIVFAGNMLTGATDRLRSDLPRLAAGQAIEPPTRLDLRPVAWDAAQCARVAGTYDLNGTALVMRCERGQLWIGDSALVPVAADRCFAYRDYGSVQVLSDGQGLVTGLRWLSGPATFDLPRQKAP